MMPATKAARRVRSAIVRRSGEVSVERSLEEASHRPDARRERKFLIADDEDRDPVEVPSLQVSVAGDIHLAHLRGGATRLGALLEQRLQVDASTLAQAAARAGQEGDGGALVHRRAL